MNYADPEIITTTPCPACGCRELFRDHARPGEREQPAYLRCCWCHGERADLEFYEEAA
jgi:hypothetical protein